MVALYFALTFAITWGLSIPSLLAKYEVIGGPPETWMPLVGLGAFGPMFAAMISARVEGTGIKALFRRLAIRGVGAKWYVIALVAPGALFVVAAGLWNLFGHAEPLLYPPSAPAYAIAALVFPFGEEVGWRGFAQPRLIERVGPLGASAVLAVFWTLWHIPMNTLQGEGLGMTLLFFPLLFAGSIFFTFLFQRTNGSLLIAVLAHVGVHLNNPAHAMPDRSLPLTLHTIAWVVLAAALVATGGIKKSVRRKQA